MLKYTGKYWLVLAPLVKKPLKQHYGKDFAVRTMRRAKAEYRAMLDRVDDVGADNPMASNIYMCFVFFAVYRAADGKITVSDLRTISHEAIGWKPLKCMGLFMNANKPGGLKAIQKMMLENAEWLEKHPQYKAVSWDFNFDETKHRDGYYYHFTQCPLNNFARREGLLDVLPVMCDMTMNSGAVRWFCNHIEIPLAHLIGKGDVRVYGREDIRQLCGKAGLHMESFEKRGFCRLHCVVRKV